LQEIFQGLAVIPMKSRSPAMVCWHPTKSVTRKLPAEQIFFALALAQTHWGPDLFVDVGMALFATLKEAEFALKPQIVTIFSMILDLLHPIPLNH
jgi:hypothetical protein